MKAKKQGNAASLEKLLRRALRTAKLDNRPVAFILAGHNGSGKSTLWYGRLADRLKIPLVNADRLITSILPAPRSPDDRLPLWAERLRDEDERWQRLAQEGVQTFTGLIMSKKMPFAFETVFSHWKQKTDGSYESKAEIIKQLQAAGYFVVLLFVGLASVEMSVLRVRTRQQQGGHAVPYGKLIERFPRTQQAICHAAPIADMALMFDNSRSHDHAYTLARAQLGHTVLFDCRDEKTSNDEKLRRVATPWLTKVAPVGS